MRLAAASRPQVASGGQSHRRRAWRPTVRTVWVTFLAFILVTLFLLPMVRSFTLSLKTPDQISEPGAPIWPAVAEQYEYKGKKYDVLQVPIDGMVRSLALVKPVRDLPGVYNEFIDPANPDAGTIKWQGNWRTLEKTWIFSPTYSNYGDVWDLINFPRGLFNTVMIAGLGTIGTVLSSVLVAFGFARFRFPGRAVLFTLLISAAGFERIRLADQFQRLAGVGSEDRHVFRRVGAEEAQDTAAAALDIVGRRRRGGIRGMRVSKHRGEEQRRFVGVDRGQILAGIGEGRSDGLVGGPRELAPSAFPALPPVGVQRCLALKA